MFSKHLAFSEAETSQEANQLEIDEKESDRRSSSSFEAAKFRRLVKTERRKEEFGGRELKMFERLQRGESSRQSVESPLLSNSEGSD